MVESKRKFSLFIGGGGTVHDELPLLRRFMDSLPGPKILYIPLALPPDDEEMAHCGEWFQGLCKTVAPGRLLRITIARDLELLTYLDLNLFDGFFLGGGVTIRLFSFMKDRGWNNLFPFLVRQGKVVYGGSAGAIIHGSRILSESENFSLDRCRYGFGFVGDYFILCHFESGLQKMAIELHVQTGLPLLGLPERGGIAVGMDGATVVGREPIAHIGLDGRLNWVVPGASLPIRLTVEKRDKCDED